MWSGTRNWLGHGLTARTTNAVRLDAPLRQQGSLKADQHDFRPGCHSQGRSPGPCAVRRINLEIAVTLQAVVEPAPDAASHQRPGKELPAMGVSGKLQRD